MSGLTITTGLAGAPGRPSSNNDNIRGAKRPTGPAGPAAGAPATITPIPVPTPSPAAATKTSDAPPAVPAPTERPPSPPPPPISPITPTMHPARLALPGQAVPVPRAGGSSTRYTDQPSSSGITFFAANRAVLTHTSQANASQAAGPPPAPQALDFDANPDVLALKSAISILQIQRARAAADIAKLGRAKAAALDDPEAFLRDLAEGRVSTGASAPTLFGDGAGDDGGSSDDDDDDDDAGGDDAKGKKPASASASAKPSPDPAWRELPRRQNVVRCPPINWGQYAVVGESLDKLHNEQISRPTLGAPATVGPGGTYEFKGADQAGGVPGPKLVGVASPYTPGRDKLPDKKPRGPKR